MFMKVFAVTVVGNRSPDVFQVFVKESYSTKI